MNGKPIIVVRSTAQLTKPDAPNPVVVNARIKQLSDKIDAFAAKVPPWPGGPGLPVTTRVNGSPALAQAGAAARGFVPAIIPPGSRPVAEPRRTGPTTAGVYTYRIGPAEENPRVLVDRWSKMVGWKAIWDVDKDTRYPLGAQANHAR